MTDISSTIDREQRRKKIVITNSLFAVVGYLIPCACTILAKASGYSSITVFQTLGLFGSVVLSNLAIILWIWKRSKFPVSHAKIIYVAQFLIWIALYTLWVLYLNEMRFVGLFFAPIALVFLLSASNFVLSLTIAISTAILHMLAAWYGVTFLEQAGSLRRELFWLSATCQPPFSSRIWRNSSNASGVK